MFVGPGWCFPGWIWDGYATVDAVAMEAPVERGTRGWETLDRRGGAVTQGPIRIMLLPARHEGEWPRTSRDQFGGKLGRLDLSSPPVSSGLLSFLLCTLHKQLGEKCVARPLNSRRSAS